VTPKEQAHELCLAAQAVRHALKVVESPIELTDLPIHPIEPMMGAEEMAEQLDSLVRVGGFGSGHGLEDHDGCLARPQRRLPIQILVVVGPACPEATSLVPHGSPGADATGSVDELDGGVGMSLEVQPPRGLRVAPAVHSHRHKVAAFLEVAKDCDALGACASTHRPQSQNPPLVAGRPAQAEPASGDPIKRSVDNPGGPDDPTWRDTCGSRGIGGHGVIIPWLVRLPRPPSTQSPRWAEALEEKARHA
jgi:hypothetical protein